MVTEEDFDKKELAEIKRSLNLRNIPFKKSHEDPEMSLQLPNFTVIFFYKNNGQKLYNAGISANECNVKYLCGGYTPDLESVLDTIETHINKKYVAYENRNNQERASHKLLREIEETLNEHGIESTPHVSNVLLLPNDIDLMVYKEIGMANFSLRNTRGTSGYIPMSNGNYSIDLFEVIRTYKRHPYKKP